MPAATALGHRGMIARLSLALAAPLAIAAAPAPSLVPAPLEPAPLAVPVPAEGVLPGAVVARAGLIEPGIAVLSAPLALDRAGEKRRWLAGAALFAAGVAGLPALAGRVVYCEEVDFGSVGRALVDTMAFGLVGAARPAKRDTQYCVVDLDRDRAFDHAVLIGAKRRDDVLFAIPGTAFRRVETGADAGTSALLRYVGAGDAADSVAFDVEIWRRGNLLPYADARRTVAIATPSEIQGAAIRVTGFDPATRRATIVVAGEFAPPFPGPVETAK